MKKKPKESTSFKDAITKFNFLKILNLIKLNHKITLYILIFDVLMYAAFVAVQSLWGIFSPGTVEVSAIPPGYLIFLIVLSLLYLLVMVAIYSFFKLYILGFVRSYFKLSRIALKRFWGFFLLSLFNLVFLVVLFIVSSFIISFIANLISFVIGSGVAIAVLIILLFMIIILFSYSFVHISHSLFALGNKVGKVIPAAFRFVFRKLGKYAPFFVFNIIIIAAYLLIVFIIGSVLKVTVFTNPLAISRFNPTYEGAFNILSLVVFYLLNLFNRIYFFDVVRKNV